MTSKYWTVPYRLTVEGITIVEAKTAEEARGLIDDGQFEEDPGQGWVDWHSTGRAREEQ